MAAYLTGQRVPTSGIYDFAGHMNTQSACHPQDREKKMPLSKGEIFPAWTRCDSSAYWTNGF